VRSPPAQVPGTVDKPSEPTGFIHQMTAVDRHELLNLETAIYWRSPLVKYLECFAAWAMPIPIGKHTFSPIATAGCRQSKLYPLDTAAQEQVCERLRLSDRRSTPIRQFFSSAELRSPERGTFAAPLSAVSDVKYPPSLEPAESLHEGGFTIPCSKKSSALSTWTVLLQAR